MATQIVCSPTNGQVNQLSFRLGNIHPPLAHMQRSFSHSLLQFLLLTFTVNIIITKGHRCMMQLFSILLVNIFHFS